LADFPLKTRKIKIPKIRNKNVFLTVIIIGGIQIFKSVNLFLSQTADKPQHISQELCTTYFSGTMQKIFLRNYAENISQELCAK